MPPDSRSGSIEFLGIAQRHGISVMPILFDDCNFAERVAAPANSPIRSRTFTTASGSQARRSRW